MKKKNKLKIKEGAPKHTNQRGGNCKRNQKKKS